MSAPNKNWSHMLKGYEQRGGAPFFNTNQTHPSRTGSGTREGQCDSPLARNSCSVQLADTPHFSFRHSYSKLPMLKKMTTPDRSTAAAFPRYLTGEVVADSVALQWSGLYARRWRHPRVVDRLLVPATPEPHISCTLRAWLKVGSSIP
jgi:hypothetical protein